MSSVRRTTVLLALMLTTSACLAAPDGGASPNPVDPRVEARQLEQARQALLDYGRQPRDANARARFMAVAGKLPESDVKQAFWHLAILGVLHTGKQNTYPALRTMLRKKYSDSAYAKYLPRSISTRCLDCEGKGTTLGNCAKCNGTGTGHGTDNKCTHCKGEGTITQTCINCAGRGESISGVTLQRTFDSLARNCLASIEKREKELVKEHQRGEIREGTTSVTPDYMKPPLKEFAGWMLAQQRRLETKIVSKMYVEVRGADAILHLVVPDSFVKQPYAQRFRIISSCIQFWATRLNQFRNGKRRYYAEMVLLDTNGKQVGVYRSEDSRLILDR